MGETFYLNLEKIYNIQTKKINCTWFSTYDVFISVKRHANPSFDQFGFLSMKDV